MSAPIERYKKYYKIQEKTSTIIASPVPPPPSSEAVEATDLFSYNVPCCTQNPCHPATRLPVPPAYRRHNRTPQRQQTEVDVPHYGFRGLLWLRPTHKVLIRQRTITQQLGKFIRFCQISLQHQFLVFAQEEKDLQVRKFLHIRLAHHPKQGM